jgi:hypothetical protein
LAVDVILKELHEEFALFFCDDYRNFVTQALISRYQKHSDYARVCAERVR